MIIIYLVILGIVSFTSHSFNYGPSFCRDSVSTLHFCSYLDSQPARTYNIYDYLDDFIGASTPTLATSHFHEFEELLHHLCLEESAAKSCPPSPVVTCLGVKLNTLDFTLSVDSDRLAIIESLLHTW